MNAGLPKPPERAKKRPRRRKTRTASKPPAARNPARPRAKRRSLLWLWTLLFLLSLAAGALAIAATIAKSGTGQRLVVQIPETSDVGDIAARLEKAGALSNPRLFALYVRIFSPGMSIVPGEHLLRDDLSARELAQRLGRVSGRPSIKVTIPEGFQHVQIGERLERAEICTLNSFRRAVADRGLLTRLGIAGSNAEGYLFPATYDLYVDSSPEQITEQLVAEARKRLDKLRKQHADAFENLERQRGFGEAEILTFASVIEKEAAVKEERATIASVFFNRLTDPAFKPERMLQSDPTAAYGCIVNGAAIPSCTTFRGNVTAAMLRDAGNPYNTYRHPGLPPGPIANPGEGAILAVLQPERTDYFYFYARGGGRHAFSRSFQEHRGNIDAGRGK